MSIFTIGLIFWMLVFGLLAIMIYCISAFKRKMSPSEPRPRPQLTKKGKRPPTEFESDIEEVKGIMAESIRMMETAPSIETLVQHREEKKRLTTVSKKKASKGSDLFSKLKASRTQRKQPPSSAATPAIKSLRGRKV